MAATTVPDRNTVHPCGPCEACRAGKLGRVPGDVTLCRRYLSTGLGLKAVVGKVATCAGGAVAGGDDANRIAIKAEPALQ